MLELAMIGIDAFCVETCIAIFFFILCTSTKNRDRRTIFFLGLVFFTVVLGSIDIANHIVDRRLQAGIDKDLVLFWLSTGFVIVQEVALFVCYAYILCLLEEKKGRENTRKYLRIGSIFVEISIFCSLINLKTHNFYFVEQSLFVRKQYYGILLSTTLILYLLLIFVIVKKKRTLRRSELTKILIYSFTPIIAEILYTINSSVSYMVPAAAVTSIAILLSFQYENRNRLLQENMDKVVFLTDMSHEIRTPINSVIGMNEMILRECTETSIKQYAMDVKVSADSVLSIINDVLDISKIETGEIDIVNKEYSFGVMVNDLATMFRIRAEEKGLTFVLDADEDISSELYGDEIRIRQILINLLSNAVKYTKKGKVILKITGEKKDRKEILHFSVKDTGIGMKEEDIPTLFDKYIRIEEGRNRNIEGTGLGMSIVANLLSLMNTRLQVDSVYGEGTTFSFQLVQQIINDEPVGNIGEVTKKKTDHYQYKELFTAPNAKVLVVDDNDMNRRVLRGLLKKTKVQVFDVSSGVECLEIIKKEHFHIIFMDHYMPEMDGIETFREMHKLGDANLSKNAKVVMLTANALLGAEENYLQEGFDAFIAKPIQPALLEQCIVECLPSDLLEKETSGKIAYEVLEHFDPECLKKFAKEENLFREHLYSFYSIIGEVLMRMRFMDENIGQIEDIREYEDSMERLMQIANLTGVYTVSEIVYFIIENIKEQSYDQVLILQGCLEQEIKRCRKEVSEAIL